MATPQLKVLSRVPPHNHEAEQSVLGAILLEQNSMFKVLDILSPDGSDFYYDSHQKIFKGMVKLYEKHTPVDVVTLADIFQGTDELASVGGFSYVVELVETVPTAANIIYYAQIVKGKSLIRKLISAANEISSDGYERIESVDDFLDQAEQKIFQIAQDRNKKNVFALKDIIKDAFEAIEKLYERKSSLTGISSGFSQLDKLTSGLQDSDLIIVAGRPAMGKTSFALNIAENAAVDSAAPVAVFSLEMSKEQLVQRMLASRARIDLSKLRNGHLKDEDWGKLTTAVGTLYEAPIYIDDTPAQTVLEMRAKARRWKDELGIRLVVVDYLQLMRGRKGFNDSREQEISDISRSLKALAKELHIPVIALSQLSRRAEQREGNIPQLSDLRESGAIEQDADMVMFVYREGVYKKCECPAELCTCGLRKGAEIIIAKQRNGPTGSAKLTFMNEYTRFEDQAPAEYDQGAWVE